MNTPEESSPIYVVDTDCWIELERHYPRKNFGNLWERLDRLAAEGRILVPEEVRRELGDDASDPVKWLRDNNSVIRSTASLWNEAREIAGRHGDLVNQAKPKGTADPFVVALALQEQGRQSQTMWPAEVIVVTQERRTQPGKTQIPDACDAEGLAVTRLDGMFDREGWTDL